MPTLTQLLNSLNESQEKQVALLNELKQQRPGYIFSLPFTLFGPATVKLADGDEKAALRAEAHWTPTCIEHIQNEEFRYISAEFDRDYYSEKDGKHIGSCLLAAGLTNRPFVKGMEPVTLNDDGKTSYIDVITTGHWYHLWYGEFTVTLEDLEQMVDNKDKCMTHVDGDSEHGPTELVVDYNHGSLAYGPDNSKAAGWVRGKGIWIEKKKTKASVQVPAQKLNAPASPDAPPAETPKSGGTHMDEKIIRETLGLAEGVEVTEDHRNQALVKLHEQNQAHVATHTALVAVVGDVDQSQLPVMLAEGKLPGKVILSEADHQNLVKSSEALAEIQKADGKEPIIVLGKVVLTGERFNALTATVESTSTKLKEMEVDKFLDANQDRFTDAERDDLRELCLSDLELGKKNVLNRSKLSASLFSREGDGNDPEVDETVGEVESFVAAREGEHVKANMPKHQAYSLAVKDARKKFTPEQMEAFEHQEAA